MEEDEEDEEEAPRRQRRRIATTREEGVPVEVVHVSFLISHFFARSLYVFEAVSPVGLSFLC